MEYIQLTSNEERVLGTSSQLTIELTPPLASEVTPTPTSEATPSPTGEITPSPTEEATLFPSVTGAPSDEQGKDVLGTGSGQVDVSMPMVSISVAAGIAVGAAFLSAIAVIGISRFLKKRKKGNEITSVAKDENLLGDEKIAWVSDEKVKAESVGSASHIGKRSYQQDSFGITVCKNGLLAVVADGMGGLADGDKVSQKIVSVMLKEASRACVDVKRNDLYQMLSIANSEVNHMLRAMNGGKSGSTVVAVLAQKNRFHWMSVGDSRIYLFREGKLLQLNSEHIYERELMVKAVNQYMTFSEAAMDRQRNRVTSYVGMGEIKHIDGSLQSIEVKAGDRILLMSDGVFNTLSNLEISAILMGTETAAKAAKAIEEEVLMRKNPKQDNFTVIVLDF